MTTPMRRSPLGGGLAAAIALVGAVVGVPTLAGCTPAPTPPPSVPVPVALAPIEVVAVGDVRQGATSDAELVIRITELESDSLPRGPGEFQLTLTDSAGSPDGVSFTGTSVVVAPGSLGATADLTSNDVLTIRVVDTDTFNVEQMTISGLRISASTTAPVGALALTIGACSGTLAGCGKDSVLPPPGTVVAGR